MSAAITSTETCGQGSALMTSAMRFIFAFAIIAAVLVLIICPLTHSDAADGELFERDYIYYKITSEDMGTVDIYGCNSLNINSDLTIPDTVTYIEKTYHVKNILTNSFYGCDSLRTVILGTGIKTIGNSAFSGCTSLTSVYIGDDTEKISDEAFSGCTSLREVRIGNSMATINSMAFSKCYRLVEIRNDSALHLTTDSSDYGGIAKYAVNIYSGTGGSILESVNLGEYGKAVFYSKIPDGTILVAIDDAAKDMVLPDNLSDKMYSIGKYAFYDTDITSVKFGSGIIKTENNAFSSCTKLSSVTLNDGLTSIGDSVFESCPLLRTISIPDSVIDFGNRVFYNCVLLSDVSMSANTNSIGNGAFYNCYSLKSFTVGDSVVAIGSEAFDNCTSLESVTIGCNVSYIMDNAFRGCNGLIGSLNDVHLRINATNVPDNGTDIFPDGTYIIVPSSKLSDYKSRWADYSDTIVTEYSVIFMNGSDIFHKYTATSGTEVVLPTTEPTKESTEKSDFKFKCWDKYEEGMKVNSDLTFNAVFEEIPKEVPVTKDGNDNTVVYIIIIVAALLAAILIAVLLIKKKRNYRV